MGWDPGRLSLRNPAVVSIPAVTITIASLLDASIEFDPAQPALQHAADELQTHLRAAAEGWPRDQQEADRDLSEVAQPQPRITVRAGAAPTDGFELTITTHAIEIAGDSPRGALNGVYWLLEQLGFLWVRPGEQGTRFVRGKSVAPGEYKQTPLFPRRTLILGNDALHDDWPDWLEFASRNRYNSVFFHDTPPSAWDRQGAKRPTSAEELAADGRGWLFERWETDGPAITEAAVRRGITLQFGGHHLPALLPRELFAEHPDWFPMRAGNRDVRYNLCTSSAGAMAEVRRRAREFFQRFAGAQVYHLWADDITGGGWCECPECDGLSPSDQALRATNVVAEALADVWPAASVAHLAYHDTIAPPEAGGPAPNVSALYAPRNRNYAFAIDDPGCSRNSTGHFSELTGLARTFDGRPTALAVFEYYSDAILYKWLNPPNLRVLPADARAYADAGVFDLGNLAVTPRPWPGPTWHAWWFARCAWSKDIDMKAELTRFCEASFGPDAVFFVELFERLDDGYRLLLDLGELDRIPRHDVLDFSDTPREALSVKATQLRAAIVTMNAAVADLPLNPDGLGRAFRDDLAVQVAFANHLSARINAWDAALAGGTEQAAAELELARLYLSALEDWDRVHTPAAYANLSRAMLRAAHWHTDQIERLID